MLLLSNLEISDYRILLNLIKLTKKQCSRENIKLFFAKSRIIHILYALIIQLLLTRSFFFKPMPKSNHIQVPFRIKLAVAISTIAVGITSISLYFFYTTTYRIVLHQIGERLKNVGHTGSHLFNETAREQIKRLIAESEQKSLPVLPIVQTLKTGGYAPSLPDATAEKLMQSQDFQQIVQLLRRINQGSRQQVTPFQPYLEQQSKEVPDPSVVSSYLFVRVPQASQAVKFIADSLYKPLGDWPGNPIGNLFNPPNPLYLKAFSGDSAVSQDFYKDDFGTWMTAAIPMKDRKGDVIAVLGVDLEVTSEANELRQLRYICFAVVGTSALLSIAISILVAQWLSHPIAKLRQGAEKVRNRDFSTTLNLKSNDEWGLLADAFNAMVIEIRNYAASLQTKNEELEIRVAERTGELTQANAAISVLNEKLKSENLRMGAELGILKQMQQMILPKSEELEIKGLDIAGFMQPADEVGGDYYDVLQIDGVVTICMGDVTGHGLESGILMLMTQTAVRTLKEIREQDQVRFFDTLNRTIYKNVQRMNSQKNLTLVVLNYADGKVSISGQHEETIVVRNGGYIERIDTIDLGFPIGLDDDITDFINHTIVELHPGDGIVLYTDGITEAMDIKNKQYGLPRLCNAIAKNWHLSANEIKQAVIEDVRQHIGTQKLFDDITLLVFKRQTDALEAITQETKINLNLP